MEGVPVSAAAELRLVLRWSGVEDPGIAVARAVLQVFAFTPRGCVWMGGPLARMLIDDRLLQNRISSWGRWLSIYC